jgi:hypothetical protein
MWTFVENVPGTAVLANLLQSFFSILFTKRKDVIFEKIPGTAILTHKQIITPLSRKMCPFLEKIPGTAIWVWYDVYFMLYFP